MLGNQSGNISNDAYPVFKNKQYFELHDYNPIFTWMIYMLLPDISFLLLGLNPESNSAEQLAVGSDAHFRNCRFG
jgi:hypothetical protein